LRLKHWTLAVLAIAVSMTATMTTARADYDVAFMKITNHADKWVWVTAYDERLGVRRIQTAFCVNPHATVDRGSTSALMIMRVEVTNHNCAHPVYYDHTMSAPNYRKINLEITGENGKYAAKTT
jgi:hypothetical protein